MEKLNSNLSLALLLLLLLVVFVSTLTVKATTETTTTTAQSDNQNAGRPLPTLLDFAKYQQMFHKHYGSLVETLTRRAYFIPRALRVLSSAVAYKFGQKDYHLALNHFSDITPHEIDSMQNHALHGPDGGGGDNEKTLNNKTEQLAVQVNSSEEQATLPIDQSEQIQVSDEQLSKEINQLVGEEPEVRQILLEDEKTTINELQRNKRTASQPALIKRRHSLHLRDLISVTSNLVDGAAGHGMFDKLKFYSRAHRSSSPWDSSSKENKTNVGANKNNAANMNETIPLADQIKRIDFYQLDLGSIEEQTLDNRSIRKWKAKLRKKIDQNDKTQATGGSGRGLSWFSSKLGTGQQLAMDSAQAADQIFVDHSSDVCMDLPRHQGTCGSCWAFATIAIYEWLYCKANNNKLVQFSEQYLVDCARDYFDMGGCRGANSEVSANFISNFGLELRQNYPYNNREQTCPLRELSVHDKANIKSTGYIRFDSASAYTIPQSLWEEYVHFTPLHVAIFSEGTDFMEYGGGVHELKGCKQETGHAMVLVGYGQENGRRYWKLRNSYGLEWGELGHYRVAQSASGGGGGCMRVYATAYATKNAREFEFDSIRKNESYRPIGRSNNNVQNNSNNKIRRPEGRHDTTSRSLFSYLNDN